MRRTLLCLLGIGLSLPAIAGAPAKYIGAATCSSSNCHGGTAEPKHQFTLWATEDPHAKAYRVLSNADSQIMAQVLKLEKKPWESEVCLTCHAITAPEEKRGPKFDIRDGVSCESCHGAASAWLEPHTRKNWLYKESLKLGMDDNHDLIQRGTSCLRCHAGIDHRLLSAGHPDLIFELDTYSAVMPKHWREKQKGAGAKAWAVGQALALRDSMKKLAERCEQNQRLDEAEMNCFSCHHNLYDLQWPILPTTTGRPVWNGSRYAVFRHFLAQQFPEQEKRLTEKVAQIAAAFREPEPDLREIAKAAHWIEKEMENLLPKINELPFEPARTLGLIKAISADQESYLTGGFRVAEQGLMAVDALSLSLQADATVPPPLLKAVKKLYEILDLKDPAHYKPSAFAEGMGKLQELISK